jgi:ribosomal protein S18 acetylase RimI-like enzyme
VWAFDRLRVTEEDRARPAMYAQELERQRAEKQAASLEDFLRSLQLEVRIAPMSPKDLARVAQLTQRTNQMNFTTVRRSESDIQALLESGKAECLTVHVSDRFGSYGLAGAMIFRGGVDAISIDTFLLSCRALGRGVEHRMLAALGRIAQQRGLAAVEARYVRSQRNRPALLFLESVGLQFQSVRGEALLFRFPAEFAAGITYEPSAVCRGRRPLPRRSPATAASRDAIPYARIATECAPSNRSWNGAAGRTSAAALRPSARAAALGSGAPTLPHLVRDAQRAAGGHSRQLLRSGRPFPAGRAIALAPEGRTRHRTVARSGVWRGLHRGGTGQGHRAARNRDGGRRAVCRLLAEVESLTDEEVRELLAKESGEAPY